MKKFFLSALFCLCLAVSAVGLSSCDFSSSSNSSSSSSSSGSSNSSNSSSSSSSSSISSGLPSDEPLVDSVGLEYKLIEEENAYQVTGIGTCTDTFLVIPAEHEGKPVTSIASRAFYECDKLTSVVIGDSVESIGNGAFCDCGGLTSIEIPDSVESIGWEAFMLCNNLTNAYYMGTADSWAQISFGYESNPLCYAKNFYINNELVTEINLTTATKVSNYAFYRCTNLTSVVIGDSVESIGEYAFFGCPKLVEVVNKSPYITVEKGEWDNGCVVAYALAVYNSTDTFTGTKLSNDNGYIVYTDGAEKILVNYIGEETDLILPAYITKINRYAFGNYDNLTSVVIGDGVTSICEDAFSSCDNLTSIEIPDSVTTIGDYAFRDCKKLVEVVNKSPHITVEKGSSGNGYVGKYAFVVYNSTDTFTGTKVSIDNGYIVYTEGEEKILVGYIGEETDLVLPTYITKINQHAFYSCDNLTSVIIGDSVTYIGDYAFEYCANLTSIVIGDSVESIGNSAFYYCDSLTSIVIPDSVTSIGKFAFSFCDKLTSITVSENNTAYASQDGILYNKAKTEFILIPANLGGDIRIPNGVISIDADAFYNCSNLTSVVISDSVTSIGDSAFYNCSNLTSVVIGDSVAWIGDSAFRGCANLTSIEIPDSVTSIGDSAFSYCPNLTSVYYKGTASDWENIAIDVDGNDNLTSATRYYYIENQADVPTDGGNYWHYVEGVPTAW